MKKISIIGAGNVGALCAQRIADRGYADIVLLDVIEGLARGRALDIMESLPISGTDVSVVGTADYRKTAGSDMVIITAGLARKPGMSRDDLLKTNMDIVSEVIRRSMDYSPEPVVIVATNPVDALTYMVKQISGLPRGRVFGLSGVLDSSRFQSFIAEELNVSVEDISACIIGQHGGAAVVIPRLTTVCGIPITRILPEETISRLVDRTIKAGAEIVDLLKTGSASFAPSAAISRMVDAVVLDKKKTLTCVYCLDGEYGLNGTAIGVPVKVGINGVEQVIELDLTDEERVALASSAEVVKDMIGQMKL